MYSSYQRAENTRWDREKVSSDLISGSRLLPWHGLAGWPWLTCRAGLRGRGWLTDGAEQQLVNRPGRGARRRVARGCFALY